MIDPVSLTTLYLCSLLVNIIPFIYYAFGAFALIVDINLVDESPLIWLIVTSIITSRVLISLIFRLRFQRFFNIHLKTNITTKIGYTVLFLNAIIMYFVFYTQFGPYFSFYNNVYDNYYACVHITTGLYYGSFRHITFSNFILTQSVYLFSKHYLQVAIIYNFIEIFLE